MTKYVNELYADVFARSYGFKAIGLRYFNVFGQRQDPNGAYAAVIPKWTASMIAGDDVFINGDGETSRDFCLLRIRFKPIFWRLQPLMRRKTKFIMWLWVIIPLLNDLHMLRFKWHCLKIRLTDAKSAVYREVSCRRMRHSQASIAKIRTGFRICA